MDNLSPFLSMQINISGTSTRTCMALDRYANISKAKLIFLSETKTESEIQLSNYYCLLKPKATNPRRSGGVALLHHSSLTVDRLPILEAPEVDAIFAILKIGSKRVMACAVYCPPNSPKTLDETLKCISKANSNLSKYKCQALLVVGDLNARHQAWNDKSSNRAGEKLLDFISSEQLHVVSCLKQDTFLCDGGGSHIDLTIVSSSLVAKVENQTADSEVELFTGAPYRGHIPVWTTFSTHSPEEGPRYVRDWKRTDWNYFKNELEQQSSQILPVVQSMRDANDIWDTALSALNKAAEVSIPLKLISPHSKPYWTPKLSHLSKELRRAKKEYKYRSTIKNKQLIDELRQMFSDELRTAKKEHLEEETAKMNAESSNKFWSNFRKVYYKPNNRNIGTILDGNCVISNDQDKAEKFYDDIFKGKHLEGQNFNNQWNKHIVEWSVPDVTGPDDLNKDISVEEILSALQRLQSTNKSPDCDGVHPCMLQNLPELFIAIIYVLFNRVLETHSWPWSNNTVMLLKKPGKDSYMETKSYRPITISSYVGKLLERILERRLRCFAELKGIIPPWQYGFRKDRSTDTYITNMISTIEHRKKSKEMVSGLFLDLQKAFDSIWHKGMLYKLVESGITGRILLTLQDFLMNRYIKMKVNQYISPAQHCPIGLPQGSVLSPFLFILYTNDMLRDVEGVQLQFADDCSVISWSTTSANLQSTMDHNCNRLTDWLDKWQLAANCQKTDLITFTGTLVAPLLQQQPIQLSEETKVLGITIDSGLNFKTQQNIARGNLSTKWNMIKPHIHAGLSMWTIRKILTAVIIPKACYGSHLWDRNHTISIYNQIKEMLRIPYNPSTELIHAISSVLPIDLLNRRKRLSTLRQLVITDNTDILQSNIRSSLYTQILTDVKALCGRKTSFGDITQGFLKKGKLNSYVAKETCRRWNSFTHKSRHDSSTETLLPLWSDFFIQTDTLQLLRDQKVPNRTAGFLFSLVSGQCNLQLFQYKIGITYSPTCACLEEDETPGHYLFRCPLYSASRLALRITPETRLHELGRVVKYIQETRRFV